ncbi:MAG TPA: tripartite tricarboxylate transporter substrate binding protein [Acetobacteraceae bacterium]|nr:tripartite tricarboxylate transporter substrate binding protein [Acetobacteraceae bacterium]
MTQLLIPRRRLAALAAAPLALPGLVAAQGDWPNRPITIVVPYPPGGTSDLSARPLTDPLARILGQPVVIENRAGAGGTIGAEAVARARPDGHTLLAFPQAVLTVAQHMMQLPFDPATAFQPLSMSTVAYGIIAAHPSVPFRDVPGFIAHARAHPNQLRFGSAGPGSITQLSGEVFADAAGIRIEHVPYRGSAPSLTDLLAGRIQLLFDPVATPAVVDGRLIGLATNAQRRNPQLPNLPTLRELGMERAEVVPWFGMAVPAGVPAPIFARLADALQRALALPEVATAMTPLGLTPSFEPPDVFTARVTRERAMFGELIRRLDIRV